jgi:hypothetical protein
MSEMSDQEIVREQITRLRRLGIEDTGTIRQAMLEVARIARREGELTGITMGMRHADDTNDAVQGILGAWFTAPPMRRDE